MLSNRAQPPDRGLGPSFPQPALKKTTYAPPRAISRHPSAIAGIRRPSLCRDATNQLDHFPWNDDVYVRRCSPGQNSVFARTKPLYLFFIPPPRSQQQNDETNPPTRNTSSVNQIQGHSCAFVCIPGPFCLLDCNQTVIYCLPPPKSRNMRNLRGGFIHRPAFSFGRSCRHD